MRLAILLSSVFILSGSTLSAGIVLTLSPLTQTASLGSTTIVEVGISGLGVNAAPSLGAYDLNIAFDPAELSFTSLTFGDPMQGDQLDLSGAGTIADYSSAAAGELEFFEISLDPATLLDAQQSNNFILAALAFKATGVGNDSLVLSVNSVGDSAGASLAVALQSATVNVVATPEPSTFGFPLILVALLIWRGNRRSV
jgi:hypothetical protein